MLGVVDLGEFVQEQLLGVGGGHMSQPFSGFLAYGLVPQVPHPPVMPDEDHRLLDAHALPT